MVATGSRSAAAAILALTFSLTLAACSPRPVPPSSITVEYVLGGETLTVTMHPEAVDCDPSTIGASAVLIKPVGLFTFGRAIGDGHGRLLGGVEVGGGILRVESDAVELPEIAGGLVDLGATEVTGRLIEDPDSPGDGIPVTGTLTAHLECDAEG